VEDKGEDFENGLCRFWKDDDVWCRPKVRIALCNCACVVETWTFRSRISSGYGSFFPGAKMHKSRAPNRLISVLWHLIFVGPHLRTCFMSAFLAPRILRCLLEFCKILVPPPLVWYVTPLSLSRNYQHHRRSTLFFQLQGSRTRSLQIQPKHG